MKCPTTGEEHQDFDFDADGLSTTGLCDCISVILDPNRNAAASAEFNLEMTPTEDGPEGEESYENPEVSDD